MFVTNSESLLLHCSRFIYFLFILFFLKQTKHLTLPGKELICVTRLGDGLCVINTK